MEEEINKAEKFLAQLERREETKKIIEMKESLKKKIELMKQGNTVIK